MTTLGECCLSIEDGDWIETKDQGEQGYRLLQISNIGLGQFRETGNFRWVTAETFQRLRCNEIRIGDVLVARMPEPTGRCWYVDNLPWPAITAVDVAIVRTNPELLDPLYCSYFLNSPQTLAEVSALTVGTTRTRIKRTDLASLEIALPSLHIQKSVAGHLRLLDKRITLLRETNATLEAIAQALFKSWFVDFDPVRAKMAGRAPEGMDEATAALFPDALEESELGLVPKGWQVCAVEDFAEKVGMGPFGSNIKVETFVESGVPVISGQHLKQMMVEDNTFNFITPEHAQKLAKSCVQHGDVIFTHAGSIGQVSYLHRDSEYQSYVLSQRQFFLRCDPDLMSPQWITRFFKSPAGQHLLLANTSQVGVPSIARPVTYLRSIRLVIPPPPVMQQFSSVCAALDDRVICNRKHIAALTQVRDTLLPRLISGQIRLPEAHAQLEDALA